jgi:hypothetical protein
MCKSTQLTSMSMFIIMLSSAYIATEGGVWRAPAKGSWMSRTNRVDHQSFIIIVIILFETVCIWDVKRRVGGINE